MKNRTLAMIAEQIGLARHRNRTKKVETEKRPPSGPSATPRPVKRDKRR